MNKQEALDYINCLPDDVNLHVIINTPDSLKASEVMALLNISRPTLCHYVKKGLIKIDTNYTGKQYRYNKESVLALLSGKSNTVNFDFNSDGVKDMFKREGFELDFDGFEDDFGYNKYLLRKEK